MITQRPACFCLFKTFASGQPTEIGKIKELFLPRGILELNFRALHESL